MTTPNKHCTRTSICDAMISKNLLCIHRNATSNVGDTSSIPSLYFQELLTAQALDIRGYLALDGTTEDEVKLWLSAVYRSDALVIGGGGLFGSEYFEPSIHSILHFKRERTRTVVWGAGHNGSVLAKWDDIGVKRDHNLDRFDLVGIRDYNTGYEWVPCVSCMSELFDRPRVITEDVVVFSQSDLYESPLSRLQLGDNVPRKGNLGTLADTLDFLGSAQTVLTDSFHGAYWSTLLGRNVVAFPTSEKFYGLKHPIPLCQPEDWKRYSRLKCLYTEALAECREANIAFSEKVFDYLGI